TAPILRAAIALALASVILAIIMFQLNAPYAAAFELSVCAGLIPVIFVSVSSLVHRLPYQEYLRRRQSRIFRFMYLPVAVAAAAFIVYYLSTPIVLDLPFKEAVPDVRDLLWNWRRLDLFGQIMVLMAGAFGVLILFRRDEKK
ncbi:MAG: hypothetical protein NT030_04570, partial [Candidatus Saganbacteria bacterium]|nr:hypothetical protein [Candidatus Saganbacteria bacterium]